MGLFSSIGGILGGIGGAVLGGPVLGGSLGAVIGSGLGGSVGGAVDANKANKSAQGYYNEQMSFAQQQAQFQQDYARNAIQWRIEDAKKAGIHPLAALGVSNPSYSPVSAPSAPSYADSSSFDTGSEFGQNLNRASFQAKTQEQQIQSARLGMESIELQNRGLSLDNEFKMLQIQQLASQLQNAEVSSAPAPKVNQNVDTQLPSGRSITSGTRPLLDATRVGNSITLHINHDISDAITEDLARNLAANIAAEAQMGRIAPEVLEHFTQRERDAVKRGDAVIEYSFPSQFFFRWKGHMRSRKNPDGSVSGRIIW